MPDLAVHPVGLADADLKQARRSRLDLGRAALVIGEDAARKRIEELEAEAVSASQESR
jgi:hypothetical protein